MISGLKRRRLTRLNVEAGWWGAGVIDGADDSAVDLSARAVEMSRGGGASAVARVLREQEKGEQGNANGRSKL